jgi:methionyl-tRNA formyltransferase
LLPQYRGAAPINWAIINGNRLTGVSTFFLKHDIDTGDLIFQESMEISPRETAGSLHDKLMVKGARLVVKTLTAIEAGDYQTQSQTSIIQENETLMEAPKLFKETCQINWNKSAHEIDRLIRGLSPYPTAWSLLQDQDSKDQILVKIFHSEPHPEFKDLKAGQIAINNHELFVGCSNGALKLLELQLAGKKRMSSTELLNGFDVTNYYFSNHD